jgi:hypothetical protein
MYPTADQIVSDPHTAPAPTDAPGDALAPLVTAAAERDAHAAWVYTGRLTDPQARYCARLLLGIKRQPDDSPHNAEGRKAMTRVLGVVGREL